MAAVGSDIGYGGLGSEVSPTAPSVLAFGSDADDGLQSSVRQIFRQLCREVPATTRSRSHNVLALVSEEGAGWGA